MIKTDIPIYLASKSPRRKKLLEQVNLKFKTIVFEFEEKVKRGEDPLTAVKRLSLDKLAEARKIIDDGIIITADTIVVLDNKIIGKPKDEKDAVKILKNLSGRTHIVYTAFSLHNPVNDKTLTSYEKTNVTFRELEKDEITDYVKSGSPMDKAGAYGIQDDFGAVFVKKINGCYYNVVGLPLPKLYEYMKRIL